jgi:predicted ArsR family transcriptional regulator
VSDQLALFRGPQARAVDPMTSHVAAATVNEPGVTEFRILSAFDAHGALADDELVECLPDMYGPTVRTARSRLTKRGLLVATNGTRLSARGRPQTIWTVA